MEHFYLQALSVILYRNYCESKEMKNIRTIDLFCGAGGSSWGARLAGAKIVAGFDLWELAGKNYVENFPDAKFMPGRLEEHNPTALAKSFGDIDLILASPECTNHSCAKGKVPRCEKSRETAFQVTRFAKTFRPRWIVIENVVNMRRWHRYQELLDDLDALGYHVKPQVLNSAEFGVPQSRRRLFILCDLERDPPQIQPSPNVRLQTARDIIDQNGTYEYSLLRSDRRAKPTLERADRAIEVVGPHKPFLLVYYGSDQSGGWQRLDRPLRTITTLDRFAFVKPSVKGHVMRMLQVPELKAAMGMPDRMQLKHGSRRERIRMVGNAVCPPVMRNTIRCLLT